MYSRYESLSSILVRLEGTSCLNTFGKRDVCSYRDVVVTSLQPSRFEKLFAVKI